VIEMVTGDEGEGAMFRKSTTITAVGAALVLALPATALGQSSERFGEGPVNQFDAQATEAQVLRGQALDRYYGIGEYSGAKVDPATQAQILRGQALGRYYEGAKVDPATEAQIVRGQALGRYYEGSKVVMLNARERSFDAKSQVEQSSPLDARETAFGAKRDAQLAGVPGPDAFERAVITNERSKPVIVVDDRFRLDPNTGVEPGPVQVTNTRDIEWPQVGIGLGIGFLLMIGLYLALKATRQRPLAH
jgi:hypothetical protein